MQSNLLDALETRLSAAPSRGTIVARLAAAGAVARRVAGAGLVGTALIAVAGLAAAAPAAAQEGGCGIYCETDDAYSDALLYSLDSDGDGLSDGDESDTYGTNPNAADTDGDSYPDGYELFPCSGGVPTNPLDPADYFDSSGCLH